MGLGAINSGTVPDNLGPGEEMKSENEEVLERGNTPHTSADHNESQNAVKRTGIRSQAEFSQVLLRVPVDVAQFNKENGGGGFVDGLVRSVMR